MNPEDPRKNQQEDAEEGDEQAVLEEPGELSLEELGDLYKVDSEPSNTKETIGVDDLHETLLSKMTDGSNLTSVKIAIARYSRVPVHAISKRTTKLVANGFPGGDIAELSQYVEKLFKYSDELPQKESLDSDGDNPDDL